MSNQILYPKFKAFTVEGLPAAGYRLYTYEAGTTTPATTYSDHLLTVQNTNPVVLNELGEAVIYTRVPLKLVLKTPVGDTVMTQDWVAARIGYPPLLAQTQSGTTNNRYVADVLPVVTSLADGQQVTFVPDVDNVDTIGTKNFSGTGVNDLQWGGPYIGTTSGSTFRVVIDGVRFQGTGLNDLSWGGTAAPGINYSVKITATTNPNKFSWKKTGGDWSSDINITGAWQNLDSDVKIKFGSTTGHTLNDLWNLVDSFKWQRDSGNWTTNIPITGDWQSLVEGVRVKFSSKTGHVLNDTWSVQVELPPTLNFCNLGYKVIYKNVGGTMQALDGGDLKAGSPICLVYSAGLDGWVLLTPQVPVWEPERVQRLVDRVEVIGDYNLTYIEHGKEVACYNTDDITLYLPQCSTVAGVFYDVKACGTGNVTLQAYGSEKIYHPRGTTSVNSFSMQTYGPPQGALRIATNGIDWHILMLVGGDVPSRQVFTSSGTWNRPPGVRLVFVEVYGGGGGGGGTNGNGSSGGTSSFGSYCSATGGGGGSTSPGSGGSGSGGDQNFTGGAGGRWYLTSYDPGTNSFTTGGGFGGQMPYGSLGGANGPPGSAGVGVGSGGYGADGAAIGRGGGGAGGYSCKWINVSGVTSVTVTVGSGGSGGSSGGGSGAAGAVVVWEFR